MSAAADARSSPLAELGLALSGGGFRATLFHVGALWRLNELGFLPKLDSVGSVSGGSITSAVLALAWKSLAYKNDVCTNFIERIVAPIRTFCSQHIDVGAILRIVAQPWLLRCPGNSLETSYRRILFGQKTLQDLPVRPKFIFSSTDLMTGSTFTFSRERAGDWRIGFISQPTFRISQAVAASSAFPPFFSPTIIKADPNWFSDGTENADLADPSYQKKLFLGDAGIIDNLGIEALFRSCKTILYSDAGKRDKFTRTRPSAFLLTLRAASIAAAQAAPLRRREIISYFQSGFRQGTFWTINSDTKPYGVVDALLIEPKIQAQLAQMRTRLNPFSEAEQSRLINLGYVICDAAMRRHVVTSRTTEPLLPYPEFSLTQDVEIKVKAAKAEK